MMTRMVPITVSRESQERSFAAMMRGANAALQITVCLFSTQRAPVHRLQTFEGAASFDTILVKDPQDQATTRGLCERNGDNK